MSERKRKSYVTTGKPEGWDHYPYTLLYDIFMETRDDIYLPGLDTALATLTIQQRECLRLRYREEKSYREIGELIHKSNTRANQIVEKALRLLRSPNRKNYFIARSNADFQKAVHDMTIEVDSLKSQLKEYQTLIHNLESKCGDIIPDKFKSTKLNRSRPCYTALQKIKIDDMELSLRAYNCLKRAGKNTVFDVAMCSKEKILGLRNMGRKTCEEICDRMKDMYNIELADSFKYGITLLDLTPYVAARLMDADITSVGELQKCTDDDLAMIEINPYDIDRIHQALRQYREGNE